MAKVVLGLACSHSPQLSSPVEVWYGHAERDVVNDALIGTDGKVRTFAELAQFAPPGIEEQLTNEVLAAKHARMQRGVTTLAELLADSEADVAIVVGDDQHELFLADGIPTFAIFWGDSIKDIPLDEEEFAALPPGIKESRWAIHGTEVEDLPVDRGLAEHIIRSLIRHAFDLTQFTEQPAGRTLGHAFTFPRHRLMGEKALPMVPVFVNTYFEPNQPTAQRCFALGRAMSAAVESYESDLKVAVIATGGLSHMVVDEEFDGQVLRALADNDEEAMRALAPDKLKSGTSEALNWIVAGGLCHELKMTLHDYVPAYRTASGTGVGMAFASWA